MQTKDKKDERVNPDYWIKKGLEIYTKGCRRFTSYGIPCEDVHVQGLELQGKMIRFLYGKNPEPISEEEHKSIKDFSDRYVDILEKCGNRELCGTVCRKITEIEEELLSKS